MMRVVIDTNCLRASIPPKSPFYQLYLDFRALKFEWWVSTEILLEYDEILSNTYSPRTAQIVLHQLAISPNVVFSEPAFRWQLVEDDVDDNKFSDLAISCNADYLVSNDTDFNVFKTIPFPQLNVVTLKEFLLLIAESKT